MNKEQLFGLVRTVAAAGFGFMAGKGWLDGATAEALAGAVATIAVALWSFASNKNKPET